METDLGLPRRRGWLQQWSELLQPRVLTAFAALWHTGVMKTARRKELGRFIVADPKICRGRPTFKGTRVTVADVLADVERGLAWEFICYRWGDGKITKEAVAEAVQSDLC